MMRTGRNLFQGISIRNRHFCEEVALDLRRERFQSAVPVSPRSSPQKRVSGLERAQIFKARSLISLL
jgi:hypothetical protein